jgi:hypothetical protein
VSFGQARSPESAATTCTTFNCNQEKAVCKLKRNYMKKKHFLIIAAIIMIIIGALRAIGGIALLIKGNQLDTGIPIKASETQIYIVVIGLLIIAVLLVFGAINLIRNYSKRSWIFCWISSIIFIAGGLLNGILLFGQPLDKGQKINLLAVILVGLFLFLGKSGLKLKEQE